MNRQLIGNRIAQRYVLRSLIGRGGMGAVYRADDNRDKRRVAIKLIRPEFSSDPKTRRRFNKEARAFAYLKHANIVEVYDFGQDDEGTLYLVMELVEGASLRTLRHANLPLSVILGIVDQLLAALAHAHARGVVHRDLKPENVLVAQKDNNEPMVKLVDFGLASLPALASRGTQQTGTVIGTPSYMAPEQARGAKGVVGPGTDIYAVGVMLYELLCDRLPFEAEGGIELILKHVQQPVPPLQPRETLSIPPELAKAVHRALAKKPWDRFVNAADFRRALQAIDVPREPVPRFVVDEDIANDDTQLPGAELATDNKKETGRVTAVVRSKDDSQEIQQIQTPNTFAEGRGSGRFRVLESGVTQLPTPPVGTSISSVSFSLSGGEMVGRDEDLERIREVCDHALGGQGQIVVVEGESGIGKSRLTRNILQALTETGLMRAAIGLYTATEGSGVNVGLRGALEGLFGTTDMDRSAMRTHATGVLERLGVHDEHDKTELLHYLRPDRLAEQSNELGEGAVRRQRSRLALIQRLVRLVAQEMPLVLLLEDVHWATDGIAGFLESLASSFRIHATPCVVIVTVAPDELNRNSAISEGLGHLARFEGVNTHRVSLNRLGTSETLELIQQTIPLEPELAKHIAERAGGNPFYALHFLQSLRQDNRLEQAASETYWQLRSDVEIEDAIPATVADVVRARIERTRANLGEKASVVYEVLQRVAVLGMSTDDPLIEAFLNAEGDEKLIKSLDDALDIWINHNILREATSRGADFLEFDHVVIRGVILSEIPSRKLRRLHKLAAQTKHDHYHPYLQGVAQDIAEHYSVAGELESAAEYRLMAARHAEAAGNFADAAKHFEQLHEAYQQQRTLEEDPNGGPPRRVTPRSGILRISIDWSEVWLGLGRIAIAQGRYDEARKYVEELRTYAEERELLLPQGRANWLLGRIATRQGKLVDAWDFFGSARDLFEVEEDMIGVAQCLWGIGQVAQLSGWLGEARQWLQEAKAIYEGADRATDVASCLVALGGTALAGGYLQEASQHYELAHATFEGAQDRYNINYCLLGLARVDFLRGRVDDALGRLETAISAFVELGDQHGQIDCLNGIGECYAAIGQMDGAQSRLSEALAGYRRLDDRHGQGHNLRLQARTKRWRGAGTEAVQFLSQALEHLTEAGDRQGQAACYLQLARLAVELDDLERAEGHFNQAHELFTISSDAIGIASCAEVWAQLCILRDQNEEGVTAGREGLDVAEQTGALPLVARLAATLMHALAVTEQFSELRSWSARLNQLELDLTTIGEPAFEKALRATSAALKTPGIDPELRAFRERTAKLADQLRQRFRA